MSMGYLLPKSTSSSATGPVVWRGLMLQKALQQLLHEVDWGGLDVLVLDLPPGTGDTQLTIAQQVVVDGALIVSTPQSLALSDSLKGLAMFRKMNIKVLGMVQNMSVFVCPSCGSAHNIFGIDGVRKECEREGVEFLADIPLSRNICQDADAGKPTVVSEGNGETAKIFSHLATRIGITVGL